MTRGYIEVDDGVRLYYEQIGSGPAIVVPNGFYYFEELKRLANAHTLIVYDVRNRGFSDEVTDSLKLQRGILQDVDDLETLKREMNLDSFKVIGHSYIGLMAMLFAARFPDSVSRAIIVGATQPDANKSYLPELVNNDGIIAEVFTQIKEMQGGRRSEDAVEACKQFWSLLRRIYVYKSEDAAKIQWGRCELSNERNFMKYFTNYLTPSIQNIHLNANDMKDFKSPVLIIHGDKDRSAPYGGALDWKTILPNAQLVSLHDVAHVPWIEEPRIFFESVEAFLTSPLQP